MKEFAITLNVQGVLQKLKLDADFAEELEPFVTRTLELANPRALYSEVPVTAREERRVCIAGDWQDSRVLAIQLSEAASVVPYVVTCGMELQKLSDACQDPLERFWQDTLNEMVLYQACGQLEERIVERYGPQHRYAMNPGSVPGWPIDALRDVFSWMPDVEEKTGVRLTDSCLMVPYKSVSGIYFHSEKEYANCQICPRHCPNRRMEYDEAMALAFLGE